MHDTVVVLPYRSIKLQRAWIHAAPRRFNRVCSTSTQPVQLPLAVPSEEARTTSNSTDPGNCPAWPPRADGLCLCLQVVHVPKLHASSIGIHQARNGSTAIKLLLRSCSCCCRALLGKQVVTWRVRILRLELLQDRKFVQDTLANRREQQQQACTKNSTTLTRTSIKKSRRCALYAFRSRLTSNRPSTKACT